MMDASSSDRLVIKDYPIMFWLLGGGLMVAGLFMVRSKDGLIPGLIFFLIGAFLGLFLAAVTTISADKLRGTLTVQHRSLLRSRVKEYPLQDIASVKLDSTTTYDGSSGSRRSRAFRLMLVMASGEKVPLQSYYSGGIFAFFNQEKKAQELRGFLGLPSTEAALPATIEAVRQQVVSRTTRPQQEGVTDGISWRVETIAYGKSPVTRWLSPDFKLPGQFLYLAQKPKGSADLFGGLLGGMSNQVYRQMLAVYGFGPGDAPGLDTAQPLAPLDPQLDPYFISLASDPFGARQLLNSWAVTPLVQWAERYPMRQFQVVSKGQPGQLVVLFSPQGVYVACFAAATSEQIDAMARLGAELVRAQGSL